MLYIGISGKRYSGKDYLAKEIKKRLNGKYDCEIISLADKVKEIYAERNNIKYEDLKNNRELKEKHRSGIIELAEREKKEKGEDIWRRYIERNVDKSKIYIIPDCRFMIDIEFSPIILIRINASEETRSRRGWKYNKEIDEGTAEIALDEYKKFDIVIENNENNNI